MAWQSRDNLLPFAAAERYAADTFEGRTVNGHSFKGGWEGKRGEWTFKLNGGRQVYRLTWDGQRWTVTADVMV